MQSKLSGNQCYRWRNKAIEPGHLPLNSQRLPLFTLNVGCRAHYLQTQEQVLQKHFFLPEQMAQYITKSQGQVEMQGAALEVHWS